MAAVPQKEKKRKKEKKKKEYGERGAVIGLEAGDAIRATLEPFSSDHVLLEQGPLGISRLLMFGEGLPVHQYRYNPPTQALDRFSKRIIIAKGQQNTLDLRHCKHADELLSARAVRPGTVL